MNRFLPVSLAVLLLCSLSYAQSERPNVLFIFADDMAYETIEAHGILDIDTPHLDSLVERGTTFTHAYNMGSWSGAVCVASRTMLNTGKMIWNAHKTDLKACAKNKESWSQRMAAAGYETYMSGKWHVSMDANAIFENVVNVRPGMPNQVPEGYDRPKDPADYEAGWKPWDTKHEGFWKGGTHWSEVLADDGTGFLKQAAKEEKPFFMYLAFNAPHDPRQAPREYINRYPLDRVEVPASMLPEYPYADAICGKGLRDERLIPYPRTDYSVKVNRQEYFALVTHMDDQIGKLLKALEESGKADNTYIFFTADHGLGVGHHGLVGKQNMYDHSVRVPFLVVGPDVDASKKISNPVYLQDVMATSLDLAGADKKGVEFKSVLPLLRGDSEGHYDSIYGAYLGRQRMIKEDGWKLISYPEIDVKRLYDTNTDPFELNDLAAEETQAGRIARLSALLEEEMDRLGDPMSSLEAADYQVEKKKKN